MKLSWNHIDWGPNDSWYFWWFNWLPKHLRYWGYEFIWHDGPHASFGFWFFNMSWRTYRMHIPKDYQD